MAAISAGNAPGLKVGTGLRAAFTLPRGEDEGVIEAAESRVGLSDGGRCNEVGNWSCLVVLESAGLSTSKGDSAGEESSSSDVGGIFGKSFAAVRRVRYRFQLANNI